MKFLISQSHNNNKTGQVYDELDDSYQSYFSNFNIEVIPIINHRNIKQSNIIKYIENTNLFDGIILSGSGDINLAKYKFSENRFSKFSEDRDVIESKLIDLALAESKPLIGICHGMQKINEYFHGKIHPYYHCTKETYSKQGIEHQIIGTDELIGLETKYNVNQYHDHCILQDDLSNKLRCFAIDARFQTVEGFYNHQLNIVGIQWHPERKISDINLTSKIINKFI